LGYTSDYVVSELQDAVSAKREKMLELIDQYGITVLGLNLKAEELADAYIEQGIISV